MRNCSVRVVKYSAIGGDIKHLTLSILKLQTTCKPPKKNSIGQKYTDLIELTNLKIKSKGRVLFLKCGSRKKLHQKLIAFLVLEEAFELKEP